MTNEYDGQSVSQNPYVPQPGTYYANAQGHYVGYKTRPGTLTAFMVLEWITFAYGLVSLCGGAASIISSTQNEILKPSAIAIAQTAVSSLLLACISVLACTSAIGILQYRQYGIKAGIADVILTWIAIAVNIVFSIVALASFNETLSQFGSGSSRSSAQTVVFWTFFIIMITLQIIWASAKTILIRSKSAKQAAATYQ